MVKRLGRLGQWWLILGIFLMVRPASQPVHAEDDAPIFDKSGFMPVSAQGFGDRQNSWAWSMTWWRDYLYVGTNRAWHCAEVASIHQLLPDLYAYPPDDPDIDCTANPVDLPMQAEIWRWSPQTNVWERVYQSPRDVALADGGMLSRDIGYRGMSVFTDPDGQESLYVVGVSPRFLNLELADQNSAPPRILRSTDGEHFAPVPQEPGTALGDFPFASLRNQVSYKNRFYVIGGSVQGSGVLLESANPAAGNDTFRVVSPDGVIVSAVATFNDYLYIGVRDVINGYSVMKTDTSGRPPYRFQTVITKGGYVPFEPNQEILSMKEFNNYLYVGGNGLFTEQNPAELIRIQANDSWDVVVGRTRLTPLGLKEPLSGLGPGFGNLFNGHMWRMEVFDGALYVGTFDSSTSKKDDPKIEPYVRTTMGFDLYRTSDGVSFVPLTKTGFGDRFSFGVRSLQATPYGLFLGTANYYYGLQIWRYQPGTTIRLPFIQTGVPNL